MPWSAFAATASSTIFELAIRPILISSITPISSQSLTYASSLREPLLNFNELTKFTTISNFVCWVIILQLLTSVQQFFNHCFVISKLTRWKFAFAFNHPMSNYNTLFIEKPSGCKKGNKLLKFVPSVCSSCALCYPWELAVAYGRYTTAQLPDPGNVIASDVDLEVTEGKSLIIWCCNSIYAFGGNCADQVQSLITWREYIVQFFQKSL